MYNLSFPDRPAPYFISNFVVTLDGKVARINSPYWPIASRLDFEVTMELRAQCDAMVHGRNTALSNCHVDYLNGEDFKRLRQKFNRARPYTYIVVGLPVDQKLIANLPTKGPTRIVIVTTEEAEVDSALPKEISLWRFGRGLVDLQRLAQKLKDEQLMSCMVEGGPTIFGSFIEAELIDELFLTVAPKIMGSDRESLTLVEGVAFPPEGVKRFQLLSVNQKGDELYLRYALKAKGPP